MNLFEVRCYFSAFASAARSITFVLQSTMASHKDFSKWYEAEQVRFQQNELARFFVERRNEVLKEGETRINSGYYGKDLVSGKKQALFFFSSFDDSFKAPPEDVITCCKKYLSELENLVDRCRGKFPERSNPDWIFDEKNLATMSMTVEDLEESLGFPRGWTSGGSVAQRLNALKDATPPTIATKIFKKIQDSEI